MKNSNKAEVAELLEQEARLRWNIIGVFFVRLLTIASAGLLTPILVLYVTGSSVPDSTFLLLQAAFHLTAMTLDIPFGYLADRYGRKKFICGGSAILTIGALCYANSSSLFGFLLAEICLALGQAAIFGAEQALLRDSLERLNRSIEFQRIWGYALSLEMGASALTTIASGYLFAWDRRAPFFIEAILYSMLFFIGLRLFELPRSLMKKTESAGFGVRKALAKAGHENLLVLRLCFRSNPWLRWMLLASSLISAVLITTLWCQSKLLMFHQVPESELGIWFALMSLFAGAVGVYFARRKFPARNFLLATAIFAVLVAGLFLVGVSTNLSTAVVGLLCLQAVRSSSRILLAGWMKEELPSEFHATGSSISTALNRLGYCLLAFGIFPFVDAWDAREKFLALGSITVLASTGLLLTIPRKRNSEI